MGMSIVDTDRTITFDPDRVMFFGHSQGSETSPGFIAYEPQVKGAVLSGAGGVLYLSLLLKTQPVDLTQLVTALVRDDPVDEDNPTLALAQMWIERADPANYGRYFVREPQLGPDGTQMTARNIFQSEGFVDTYAPNPGIEAFATAIGGNEVVTANEKDIDGLTLRGNTSLAPPISNNLNGKTAVLAQYNMAAGSDGHFVVFEIPAAEQQSAEFLGTLAATGTATVVVPTN
jgi:pimeloyl-ACP methyl ester carboxylesterase